MPLLIIAGLPTAVTNRNRHYVPRVDDWMESQDAGHKPQSPQQLMATFAAYMTDEEVRSISVPFRAVEAMYRSIGGTKR